MSKEAEFNQFVKGLSEFLAPRFAERLTELASEFKAEIKQDAKDKYISRELQELEPMLKNYQKAFDVSDSMAKLHMKGIVKKIIELYKPKS